MIRTESAQDLKNAGETLWALLENEDLDFDDFDLEGFLTEIIPAMGESIEQQLLDTTLQAAIELDPNKATGIRRYLVEQGAVEKA